MVCKTTIKVSPLTKKDLDFIKIHPRQTYNEVIDKLIAERKIREEGGDGRR